MTGILIVDDSPVNRRLLRTILETAGYEVVGEAAIGIEGIAIFEEKTPRIVTLDVSMPEMNGIEALKLMKQHNPNAKFIILSAEGQMEKGREAIAHGVDEYITKPYKKSDILDAIARCLQD